MKREMLLITSLLFVLLLTLVYGGCRSAAPDTNRGVASAVNSTPLKAEVPAAVVESEVLRVERQWIETAKSHNVDVIKDIVADDIVLINPDGSLGTKADQIKDAESQAITAEVWDLVEPKVTVLGPDGGVVTGRTTIKNGKYKGPDGRAVNISGDYRFMDVIARRNGKWQVVASQATKVTNPESLPSPSPKASLSMSATPASSPSPSVKATP